MKKALVQILLVLLLLFTAGVYQKAIASGAALDPDSERLMELVIAQTRDILTGAIVTYPRDNEWYFPFGEFCEIAGIGIQVSSSLGIAEGFVLTESRRFRLDVNKCEVEYEGKSEKFDCRDAIIHNDDIFVPSRLLERWLPLRGVQIDSLRSRVAIDPSEKLPFEMRMEREKMAERQRRDGEDYDPGYPRLTPSFDLFEGPFIDQSLGTGYNITPLGKVHQTQFVTQASGELLGLETYAFIGGSATEFGGGRLTMKRRSAEGKLFGPLGLRQIQFFDVDLPLLPLITPGIAGRGFVLSSFPLDSPLNFESHDFEGPLPPGWEVVLYRNGVLLGRQLNQKSGRYFFQKVPLFYGRNTFRLEFYGPFGEKREEYKTFNVSPGLMKSGSRDFRLGMALAANGDQRVSFQYSQNLFRLFTGSAGFLQSASGKNLDVFVGLTGVNELFLFSSNCAVNNRKGYACEWSGQSGFGDTTFGARHTRLVNYDSELFPKEVGQVLVAQTTGNLGLIIPTTPSIGMNFELMKSDFETQPAQTNLTTSQTFGLGAVALNNQLKIRLDDLSVPPTGTLDMQFGIRDLRFRLGFTHSFPQLQAVDGELGFNPSATYGMSLSASHSVVGKTTSYNLGVSRAFDLFVAGFDATYRSAKEYGGGVRFTFSLARDPVTSSIHMSKASIVQAGGASVAVYLDSNRNGEKDPDEKVMDNIFLLVDQKEWETPTNAEGRVFIAPLRVLSPVDISLAPRSFVKDPFVRPGRPGVRIIARAGKTARIDFPVVVIGSIDGMVMAKEKEGTRPKRGIEIELVNSLGQIVGRAKTDRDGFYSMDEVAPGDYTLRVNPSRPWSLGFRPDIAPLPVNVPEQGSFESGNDFLLLPR